MTITEFLLARIDEDEKVARSVRLDEHLHHRDDRNFTTGADRNGYAFLRATSTRVLAECEAKQRIMRRCPSDWVLLDLAAVYADHPDYRQEWALG